MAANSDEILLDLSPMLRLHRNGRVERLLAQDFVPPSLDPATGVQSKDVEIDPEINLSARLYLPGNADRCKKLPLLFYYHGGGFIIESAFSPLYHNHLNRLVGEANVVAVAVNYRLAPEFPLPIAFEDSWRALKWAVEGNDEWIKEFADLDRVYLGGDSAGGNIAHNIAMRVGSENPGGFHLRGFFLNCPFFGGADPIGNETAEHLKIWKDFTDKLWSFICSNFSDYDQPWINPGKDPKIASLGCKRVLVYVAEKDFLKERGCFYKEVLSKSGWDGEVECVEVAGEDHVFSVFAPEGESGKAMINKVTSFINH